MVHPYHPAVISPWCSPTILSLQAGGAFLVGQLGKGIAKLTSYQKEIQTLFKMYF